MTAAKSFLVLLVAAVTGVSCGAGAEPTESHSLPGLEIGRSAENATLGEVTTMSVPDAKISPSTAPTRPMTQPTSTGSETIRETVGDVGEDWTRPPVLTETGEASAVDDGPGRRRGLAAGERWTTDSGSKPRLAVTPAVEGWTAVHYTCDGALDYATLRRAAYGQDAGLYIGPVRQDCPFQELVEGMPEMAGEGIATEIGTGTWEAVRYQHNPQPDWRHLGVRIGPSSKGRGVLYLIHGNEWNYFAYVTASPDVFDEFLPLAEALLSSLEIDIQ